MKLFTRPATILTLFAVFALSALSAMGPIHAADDWTPLFNGKDLDGWEQHNGTATYHVEDGVVIGKRRLLQ